ncbi:Mitochondrial intermembrane space import and assembly protein-like protein [Hapsidospora chrysogenum ATCC 11550]|uniref:Mitochondrial intermembrane space import and assembly protein 40 n=1 Tax=Hapsidospora chrysogenum (strain ATCC 11550 / CBS 779.69 / DSM 880 / IAM 14645 / JCM 23072 / IMI 49137) TaxID=857340 RepID=A0A086T1B9_HAPC1|nr:Mitochondrial intermembrane space import and assembly protein-like protein [Hapsidospora chrysogenum ATCC 11550]
MYRTALRSASRPAVRGLRARPTVTPRRFLSSSASPADKPRSWKSSALRWGLAAGALYYYNTSSIFAEEAAPQTVAAPASFADSDLPTVDSILEEKRKQMRDKPAAKPERTPASPEQKVEGNESAPPSQTAQTHASEGGPAATEGAEALEEEAGQQGAFNPETGEINWDCPCLGGMAHGPCGEEFKTAFSCFVYSEEDPKGMDCIDKFQGMQECFRKYPEIYGAELADEEDAAEAGQGNPDAPDTQADTQASSKVPNPEDQQSSPQEPPTTPAAANDNKSETVTPVKPDTPLNADTPVNAAPVSDAIPTKWDDATEANEKVETKPDSAKEKKDA